MNFNLDNVQNMIVQYGPKIIGAAIVLIIGWWIIGGIAKSINRLLVAAILMPPFARFWYLC